MTKKQLTDIIVKQEKEGNGPNPKIEYSERIGGHLLGQNDPSVQEVLDTIAKKRTELENEFLKQDQKSKRKKNRTAAQYINKNAFKQLEDDIWRILEDSKENKEEEAPQTPNSRYQPQEPDIDRVIHDFRSDDIAMLQMYGNLTWSILLL